MKIFINKNKIIGMMENSGIVWYYLTEGKIFANRKDAKRYLGTNRFKRLLTERRVISITRDDINAINEIINNK